MGILVVIALETNTVTIVLVMESGIIAINANANTATLGSITTIVLCSGIIIAIIIIAIEIAISIKTIVTIELIMVSITVITFELGIMSIFVNETVHAIEMSISCRGYWGIHSAQWQGELDGPGVTGKVLVMLHRRGARVKWCGGNRPDYFCSIAHYRCYLGRRMRHWQNGQEYARKTSWGKECVRCIGAGSSMVPRE